jgi:transposase
MRTLEQQLSPQHYEELQAIINNNESSGREVKRAQAVQLLDQGADPPDITALTGYKRSQIFNLRSRYRTFGRMAIEDSRKGKPKALLTKRERDEVVRTVKTKSPNEVDRYYNSDFWTTGILGEYILRTYNVRYKSKTSYYLVFREAKFTYHRPATAYRERDEQEIKVWRNRAAKQVRRYAKDPNTVILAGDEMVLTTATTVQKIWLPAGEYPRIEVRTGGRKRRHLYGFLNLKTGKEHAFKTSKQTMHTTKDILKSVRTIYPKQRLIIFWDRAGWHTGSAVQTFLADDKRIVIEHFPRYAPEEDPQEHVWKSGRSAVTHNRFIDDIDAATDELADYLNRTTFPYSLAGVSLIS